MTNRLPFKNILTLGDKLLISTIFILSVMSLFAVSALKEKGEWVVIEVDGTEKYRLKLTDDQEVTVTGPIGKTTIQIKQGKADVVQSDCQEHICVNSGTISKSGEIIVCAPNKVIVRIAGNKDNYFDEITE
jgi:hypothetical protein